MSEVEAGAAEKLRPEAKRARYRGTDVKAKPVHEPAHERTTADLERVPDPPLSLRRPSGDASSATPVGPQKGRRG